MRIARVIQCVDAHAEGEPSRIVVGGVLDVPGDDDAGEDAARWSATTGCAACCLFEPRGSAPLSRRPRASPSAHPEADAGFIIMESSSYEGMSGTNTINTAAVLLETGLVEMVEPVTELVLEAPAGLVRVRARVLRRASWSGSRSRTCRRSCTALDAPVEVAGPRHAARRRGLRRRVLRVRRRRRAGLRDRARRGARRWPSWASGSARTSTEQLTIAHPLIPELSHLSFVVFVAPPRVGGDARHATIVSPGRLDRSPDRHGDLGPDRGARPPAVRWATTYVAESVIDTRFVGRVAGRTRVGDIDAVVPAITGRAWITGFHQLVVDPSDPLGAGFKLGDTWGAGAVDGRSTCRVRRYRERFSIRRGVSSPTASPLQHRAARQPHRPP